MDILDIVGQFWMANRFGVGWICVYIYDVCKDVCLCIWLPDYTAGILWEYAFMCIWGASRQTGNEDNTLDISNIDGRHYAEETPWSLLTAAWPYILEFIVFSENVRRVLRVINEVKLYTKLYTIKIYYTGTMGYVRLQSRHRIAYSSFQSECWAESKNVLLISTEWAEIN